MVDHSDLIAASVYSRNSFRDCSSYSSLRKRRSSEAPRLQNWIGCPHLSLGLSYTGIRSLPPGTSLGSAHPSTKASGPPAVDASGTIALSSAKVAGLRSPTSATTAALSSWPRTGRSAGTTGSGASAIPTSAATGGSADESATVPTGVNADTDNKIAELKAAATSAASPA
jgi:hypothetical protein